HTRFSRDWSSDVCSSDLADTAATGLAPGESDEKSIAVIAELYADLLGGHRLLANNSRWLAFPTVTTATWRDGNVVLLGDAAHTEIGRAACRERASVYGHG